VLEWVFRRCDDESETVESAIGLLPAPGELNTDGLDISDEAVQQLLTVDDDALRAQMPQVEEHLARFGDDLPDELKAQLEALKQRLE
jgi:phosphoenolpyruvate carboxykinase (GTP)